MDIDMGIETAIKMLKNVVKNAGTIDQNHIDLGLAPAEQRWKYEKALAVAHAAVKEGKLSRDELLAKLKLK